MNIIQIVGAAVGLLIGLVILTFLVFNYDLASVLATGSETLSPTGTPVGGLSLCIARAVWSR